ncbi:MAG: VWA domain-containing protein [Acidobacteriota bacterium]|nr:VWA domain-containing protein [Acidobacteriota bacterium]
MKTASLTLLPLALALVVPGFAVENQEPGFMEAIDVTVVNVEAVVTDRQGVRVPSLGARDFRLFVDGVDTPIDFFSEISGGDVVAASSRSGRLASLREGEPVGTSYLVFVDEFFTIAADRRKVLRKLSGELAWLGPEDRMAVVAWNGSGLEMLSSWSRSPRDLEKTLRVAAERPSGGLHRLAELRTFESTHRFKRKRRARYDSSFGSGIVDPEERMFIERLNRQLENGVAAATASLRGFASPNGRKVMVMLTGSWPDRRTEYALVDPIRSHYHGFYDHYGLYTPLTETANLLGYTLYPADVAGLEGESSVDASRPTRDILGRDRDHYRERTVHFGLEDLARETGGVAVLNSRRNRPLETVAGDTRTYYWLGFVPQRQADGRQHDIRLEVVPSGLRARTRGGFTDLTRGQEVAMAVESALLFGHLASEETLEVALGPSRKAGWGKIEVALTVSLPLERLTLLADDREWLGKVEIHVVARDERGNRSDVAVIPVSLNHENAPGEGDTWSFETMLKMRSRDHDMVVALYDATSGEMFASTAAYSVN